MARRAHQPALRTLDVRQSTKAVPLNLDQPEIRVDCENSPRDVADSDHWSVRPRRHAAISDVRSQCCKWVVTRLPAFVVGMPNSNQESEELAITSSGSGIPDPGSRPATVPPLCARPAAAPP